MFVRLLVRYCSVIIVKQTRDIISTVFVMHEGEGYDNTRTSMGGPPTDSKGNFAINAGGSQPVVRRNCFSRFLIDETKRSTVVNCRRSSCCRCNIRRIHAVRVSYEKFSR